MISKPSRKRSEKILEIVRKQPCVVTKRTPSDPAHIRSRGAGGPDELWNLMPLSRSMHSLQHRLGWKRMSEKFVGVSVYLKTAGWTIDETGKLHHSKLEVQP